MKENDLNALVKQAAGGDEDALAELFSHYKAQLRRMISFRLDQNLKGRIDPSDVLQESFFDLLKRIREFGDKDMSFFVWLRLVTHERLLRMHRQHLSAKKRDARLEVSMQSANSATSITLAAHLLGQDSSVCGRAIREEQSVRLHQILEDMDENDREIIALRVFESLTNGETAEVLGLTKQTTSKRFVRAMARIRVEVKGLPGFG